MSQLSIDEMDAINFLLTETSLELLGNKFYDIFGQQSKNLGHLVSMKSIKKQPNYIEDDCPLLRSLKLNMNDDDTLTNEKAKRVRRKRCASTTDIQSKTSAAMANGENEESLLVPMAKKTPRLGRISARRYTCVEERPIPIDIRLNRPLVSASPITPLATTTTEANVSVGAAIPTTSLLKKPIALKEQLDAYKRIPQANRVEQKIEHLKGLVETEHKRMKINSEVDLQAYFHHIGYKTYRNKEDEYLRKFHQQQEAELLSTSNALIEFIKFIKTDKDNASKMGDIAACILKLKNTL